MPGFNLEFHRLGQLIDQLGQAVDPMLLNSFFIVIGLIMLFLGYRLFKVFIFMTGFVVGAAVLSFCTDNGLLVILGGLVSGLLALVLWYIGIFLLGALLGVVAMVMAGIHNDIVVMGVAVLFGVLAILLNRFMITVSTSLSGANLVVNTVGPMIGVGRPEVLLCTTLALAVVGIVVQYATGPKTAVASASAGAAEKPAQ